MVDHVTITVKDYKKSRDFYKRALKPLGYQMILEFEEDNVGAFGHVGDEQRPQFWISQGLPPGSAVHVAFTSDDRKHVKAFHSAALKAGGRDNGVPGPRPHYHRDYYGAFVYDPDGNNVEAVCQEAS